MKPHISSLFYIKYKIAVYFIYIGKWHLTTEPVISVCILMPQRDMVKQQYMCPFQGEVAAKLTK